MGELTFTCEVHRFRLATSPCSQGVVYFPKAKGIIPIVRIETRCDISSAFDASRH